MSQSSSAPEPSFPAASTRPPTILVAEGDPGYRERLRAALERRGFIVLTAARGSDAITIAQACQGEISLFLADRNLFGMSGRDTADLIQASRPSLQVAFLVEPGAQPGTRDDAPCFLKESSDDLGPLVAGVFELVS